MGWDGFSILIVNNWKFVVLFFKSILIHYPHALVYIELVVTVIIPPDHGFLNGAVTEKRNLKISFFFLTFLRK